MHSINNQTKIDPEKYKMIMESFDFICQNININNPDIPEKLLKFWSVKSFASYSRLDDSQTLVFLYILKTHLKSSEKVEKIMYTPYYYQLFYYFQTVIAATLYCRQHNLPITPFPLLNMNAYPLTNAINSQLLLQQYLFITKTNLY